MLEIGFDHNECESIWKIIMFFYIFHFALPYFRLIDTLDQIDTRVEKLRKEALSLSEKRDVLLMSMDIIKNNELLQGLNECKYLVVPCTAISYCLK